MDHSNDDLNSHFWLPFSFSFCADTNMKCVAILNRTCRVSVFSNVWIKQWIVERKKTNYRGSFYHIKPSFVALQLKSVNKPLEQKWRNKKVPKLIKSSSLLLFNKKTVFSSAKCPNFLQSEKEELKLIVIIVTCIIIVVIICKTDWKAKQSWRWRTSRAWTKSALLSGDFFSKSSTIWR